MYSVSILTVCSYFKGFGFEWLAHRNKLRVKKKNTIIQKWPLALKLKKGDAGFDEEFNMLFGSGNWGSEVYVEWASLD
jgi:hypothetical protein